jgi:hypothetical protein
MAHDFARGGRCLASAYSLGSIRSALDGSTSGLAALAEVDQEKRTCPGNGLDRVLQKRLSLSARARRRISRASDFAVNAGKPLAETARESTPRGPLPRALVGELGARREDEESSHAVAETRPLIEPTWPAIRRRGFSIRGSCCRLRPGCADLGRVLRRTAGRNGCICPNFRDSGVRLADCIDSPMTCSPSRLAAPSAASVRVPGKCTQARRGSGVFSALRSFSFFCSRLSSSPGAPAAPQTCR